MMKIKGMFKTGAIPELDAEAIKLPYAVSTRNKNCCTRRKILISKL